MPRKVDHEERRRRILDALFRVAASGGIAAATYRTIAAEAGIPAPQVQYYFATKGEMIEAALMELGTRVIGRGIAMMQAAGPDPSPEVVLRSAVAGSYPADQAEHQDLVLFFQFLLAGLADQSIAQSGVFTAQNSIVDEFAEQIRRAQAAGDIAADRDPVKEARLVLFANSGLVLAAFLDIHTLDDAHATMDYLLTRLFS